MNICLTGATGLLGSKLSKYIIQKEKNLIPISRDQIIWNNLGKNVDQFIEYEPDVLIHTAANTNVELCETDLNACYKDNLLLTEILVNVARILGIKFVFISSTGIYGNHKNEPYTEYDKVAPTTHHHMSKWLAEGAIKSQISNHLIIRTGWLFGGKPDNKKNFVARRIEEACLSEGRMQSDNTQIGNPTSVNDLSEQIIDLVFKDWAGTFNCVNSGTASRYEYVTEILRIADIDVNVEPVDATVFARKANVSPNESALNYKLDILGNNLMPSWIPSLKSYIHDELFENTSWKDTLCSKSKP